MPDLNVDADAVIARLGSQIGSLAAQLAVREAELEAAHKRIAELEAAPPAE